MTTNETALIRFRVDETLKQRADAVCSERGFDLTDVLRAVVRRIAMEHAIPFELSAPAAADAPAPFAQYGKFLLDCEFQRKPVQDSAACRSKIPAEGGPEFRLMPVH